MITRTMSVSQWIEVPDNPRQRDTETHARKSKHLKEIAETHGLVFAAQLPDGSLVKLDGHTRALLWQRGELQCPDRLLVVIFPVESIEDAKRIYCMFDAKDAVESAYDKLSGACREVGFQPKSTLLSTWRFVNSLKTLYGNGKRKATTYDMVKEWKSELEMLDDEGFTKAKMLSSGVITAILLTLREYGHQVMPFWRGVAAQTGTRIDGESDPVDALCRHLEIRSKEARLGGTENVRDIAGKAISCCDAWLEQRTFRTGIKGIDFTDRVARVCGKKRKPAL